MKPDFTGLSKDQLDYIESIEEELNKYRGNDLSKMYDVWVSKLSEIVEAVNDTKVEVVKMKVKEDGDISEDGDYDPFSKIKKLLSIMNEAKPTVETINWLRGVIGVKQEEKRVPNIIEDRAKRK